MDELLRMEHVSKRFGDFYANRDINLSVRKGEVHTPVSYTHLDVYKRQG